MSSRGGRVRPAAAACAAVAVIAGMLAWSAAPTSASTPRMTQKRFVRMVYRSPLDQMLSGSARTAIRLILGIRRSGSDAPSTGSTPSESGVGRRALAAPTNVRVNDPSTDGAGNPDMTIQNEVSMAVSGSNVVAAYNDDGTSPQPSDTWLSPATNISGYSWSGDGGATWQDSQLPNAEPRINLSDPVVVADASGRFFYADLSLQYSLGRVDVAVGRSDDGGQTFSPPRPVPEGPGFKFILADKPWMTVGPDPSNPSGEILYVGWQQSYFVPRTGSVGTRIVVSASRDLGATWSRPAILFSQPFAGREGFGFVNGTALAVDPATGRLYVAWEQLLDRPSAPGRYLLRHEWITSSGDGGATFGKRRVAARVSAVGTLLPACGDVLRFGTGRLIRITDFPSLAVGPGGRVLLAFNSDGSTGVPGIRVARSGDRGRTWAVAAVAGPPMSFMPDISADATGVSVVYYQRASTHTIRTELATSPDGIAWTTQDLSDSAFTVPFTFPNFDPFPAPCYLGDYVASLRSGGATYGAWGDTRDTVTNAFWPQGRPDPDVYFAKS